MGKSLKNSDANFDLRAISRCIRCGTCRSACPVFEELGWESSNARGRMLVIKRLADGDAFYSDDLDSINMCTTCGNCTENCPAGIDPPESIEDARRVLVSCGSTTAKQSLLCENISFSGNVFGESSPRMAWLRDINRLPDKADLVYFAGCLASYRYPEIAARTFDLLRRFGATLLPDEKCCGSPLSRMGFDSEILIRSNSKQIEDIGANTVITGCAGCYTTLKNNYPTEFEVMSVPEFLAKHITELDLRRLDITVTYHDPCHLGRRHKIYDEPRKVIRAICNLEEMKFNRNRSRCCGGGGGVRLGYSELSLKMARRRLLDAPENVDYIVTCCPLCIRNLNDAGGNGKVIDLVELVTKAIDVKD